MPRSIKCPNCSAPLEVDVNKPVLKCQYCGHDAKQTVAYQPAAVPPRSTSLPPPDVIRPEQARKVVRIVIWSTILATVIPGIIVAIMMVSASGRVSSVVESVTETVRTATRGGRSDEPADPEQALQEKLETYVECVNYLSPPVHDSRGRYLGWMRTPESGPTCKERCIGWGIHTIHEPKHIEDRIGKVKATSPRMPALEEAGDRFLAGYRELQPLLAQANRYYNQKDYEDDACAKARELHTKLWPAFDRFLKVDAELRALLTRDYPALLERQRARLEKSAPASPRLAFLKLGSAAQKVLQAAAAKPTDVAALRAAVTSYEEALQLVETPCTGIAPLSSFHTPCVFSKSPRESFLRTAKETVRALARPAKRPRLYSYEEGPVDRLREDYRRLLGHVPAGVEERPSRYMSCYR